MQDINLQHLKISLLMLRYGVFIVLLVWSLDKLLNSHRIKTYYPDWGDTITIFFGATELLIAIAILLGIFKTMSYGAAIILHGISTLLPYQQYLSPFEDKINLLYFTAWPMLAACISIYVFRHHDTLLTLHYFAKKYRRYQDAKI